MNLDRFEHPVVQTAALGKTGKEQSVLVAVGEKSVLEDLVHLVVLLDTRTPRDGFFFRSPEGDGPQSGLLYGKPKRYGGR